MQIDAMGWGRIVGVLTALGFVAATAACGSESTGEPPGGTGGGATGGASAGSGGSGGGAGASGGGGGATTGGASGTEGASCKVDGVVYPHGATEVPDAASCNTCRCTNGQLDACTELPCPNSCPRNQDFGTQCAECGPVDECLVVEHGCFEVCDGDGDCRDGACVDGVCVRLCG